MSAQAQAWAIRRRGLKPIERLVLYHIADHSNAPWSGAWKGREICSADVERLAADIEITPERVAKAVEGLVKKGCLVPHRHNGLLYEIIQP